MSVTLVRQLAIFALSLFAGSIIGFGIVALIILTGLPKVIATVISIIAVILAVLTYTMVWLLLKGRRNYYYSGTVTVYGPDQKNEEGR